MLSSCPYSYWVSSIVYQEKFKSKKAYKTTQQICLAMIYLESKLQKLHFTRTFELHSEEKDMSTKMNTYFIDTKEN